MTVLTRRSIALSDLPPGISVVTGDPTSPGPWQKSVPEHEVIVNLAGASIFSRWTKKKKKAIQESRILTTRHLVEAVSKGQGKVTRILNTSAVGYYGFCGDEELDEESPPGDGFLASLSRDWEGEALKAEKLGVKVTLLRFGVVLGRHGGALRQMLPLFRWYVGSPLGSGRQWFSWIHEEDLAAVYAHVLQRANLTGALNCTAPNPVRNEDLTRLLGQVLGKPTFMPAVPAFLMRLALGEFADVLLQGQKVLPKRLLESGYPFKYPSLPDALQNLLTP